MFEELLAEIQSLEVPVDPASITKLFAVRDAVDAVLARSVGEFDAAELWDVDAATSMVAWLRDRCGVTRREAGRVTARARRLRGLPATLAAWHAGELSGCQVDVVLQRVGRHHELFAQHETAVVPTLAGLSLDDTIRVMDHWRARADAENEPAEPPEPERSLHVSETLDGRVVLDGDLDPELGALVRAGLRVAETADLPEEPARTPGQRHADALGEVFRFFLDHQTARPGGRHRPHLNVLVNLAEFEQGAGGRVVDGPLLPHSSVEQLLCDCTLHRVVRAADGTIVDYGRATRTIPAPLWSALVVRDQHCRFPGCDRPSSWCDGHHVVHWEHDGTTGLDNLVLLCRRHHRRLHRPGWHAKLRPDGTLEVTRPDGTVRTTAPPGAAPPLW